jgi:hypothetical protein
MEALIDRPPGVDKALDLVGRFDHCLVHGFARLGDAQRRSLEELAATFAGSPLGTCVAEAVAAVGRSEFVPRSFLILGSARVALLGAVHDALLAQARAALGRRAVDVEERPSLPPGGSSPAMASAQHWLAELAIAGFRQLEESAVFPFAATLEDLQDDPDLTGLAALLTGFHAELLQSLPAARLPNLPAFRWGDLWSSAIVRTQNLPAPIGFEEETGTLIPLGLDVQSHDNFVCILLYGLLDDGEVRMVRVPFTHYKAGGIAGADVWDLFGAMADPVLKALAEHRVLRVTNAELREDGDLILRSPPKVGGAADPFARVDRLTALPDPPPLSRHPVHIAEVVYLKSGHGLPIADERIPEGSVLTPEAIAAAPEVLGLLRFDRGGWRLQPLSIRHPILGLVQSGEECAEARRKQKSHALEILQERASRLLRKS